MNDRSLLDGSDRFAVLRRLEPDGATHPLCGSRSRTHDLSNMTAAEATRAAQRGQGESGAPVPPRRRQPCPRATARSACGRTAAAGARRGAVVRCGRNPVRVAAPPVSRRTSPAQTQGEAVMGSSPREEGQQPQAPQTPRQYRPGASRSGSARARGGRSAGCNGGRTEAGVAARSRRRRRTACRARRGQTTSRHLCRELRRVAERLLQPEDHAAVAAGTTARQQARHARNVSAMPTGTADRERERRERVANGNRRSRSPARRGRAATGALRRADR